MENEKIIYVYYSLENKDIFVGTLFAINKKGFDSYSFQYDKEYINAVGFNIDPNLILYEGRQFLDNKKLFGVFMDSTPDRWGRMLLDRLERIEANKENRRPQNLNEVDYLLRVSDFLRMGALRFSLSKDGGLCF